MKHYDMLFIHPSAQMSAPQFIVMPMGLLSIINELKDFDVKAVNVGLELSLNKNFDLKTFLESIEFDRVGIDLHWHEHAYSALEIARLCKEVNPHCLVVVGGLTASYFAEEILNFCSSIDVVVKGEAEEVVLHLLKEKDMAEIPNIVYRNNGIKRTMMTPPHSLDGFNFSRLVNLDHFEEYLKCSIHAHSRTRFWYDFWLLIGRGCIYDCSYCGGGKSAQNKIFRRDTLTFRSVDHVIDDLKYLQDLGVHIVCPSHDLMLAGKKYWSTLFESMKNEGIYMGMYLEVFQLADKLFIEELASVCDARFTTVVITVLSGSEEVRMKNGKYFSNHDYFECIEYLEKCHINHIPYFATGLPFETRETFQETMVMTEKILSNYNPSYLFCTPLRLDPGSPMYEHPEEYGVIKHYKTFADYYDRCKKRAENLPYDYMGYHTELMSQEMVMDMQNQWDMMIKENSKAVQSMEALHFL